MSESIAAVLSYCNSIQLDIAESISVSVLQY